MWFSNLLKISLMADIEAESSIDKSRSRILNSPCICAPFPSKNSAGSESCKNQYRFLSCPYSPKFRLFSSPLTTICIRIFMPKIGNLSFSSFISFFIQSLCKSTGYVLREVCIFEGWLQTFALAQSQTLANTPCYLFTFESQFHILDILTGRWISVEGIVFTSLWEAESSCFWCWAKSFGVFAVFQFYRLG